MGGKSRKSGEVSERLIMRLKKRKLLQEGKTQAKKATVKKEDFSLDE